MNNSRVVIVGGSLGGLRAAEALRSAGYSGDVVVLSQESHLPYNRPPLSKEALRGGVDHATLEYRRRKSVADVQWRLGAEAIGADLLMRTVTLAGGEELAWDGLVAATGLRPRRLPIPGPQVGRFVLRTLDDALALREVLTPAAEVVVLGAGFIGCEVAATARGLGCHVTNVALDPLPMIRPLGELVAGELQRRLEARGLSFRLGVGVEELLGADRVSGVRLSDGDVLGASVVVEAVGSLCNTEWLAGNDLDLSDGVLTDAALRALRHDGTAVGGVHAVGDIARFPNAGFDNVARRVEHWSLPTDTGRHAGALLASYLTGGGYPEATAGRFAPVPSFWSDLFEMRLQSFGMIGLGKRVEVVEGSLDGPFVAAYHGTVDNRTDVLMGVVSLDMTPAAMSYRSQLTR